MLTHVLVQGRMAQGKRILLIGDSVMYPTPPKISLASPVTIPINPQTDFGPQVQLFQGPPRRAW